MYYIDCFDTIDKDIRTVKLCVRVDQPNRERKRRRKKIE